MQSQFDERHKLVKPSVFRDTELFLWGNTHGELPRENSPNPQALVIVFSQKTPIQGIF